MDRLRVSLFLTGCLVSCLVTAAIVLAAWRTRYPLRLTSSLTGGLFTAAILLATYYRNRDSASRRRLAAGTSPLEHAPNIVLNNIIARASDPGLLKKHSTFESYTTRSGYTYPRIRTFYKRHDKVAELPNDLPLLVSRDAELQAEVSRCHAHVPC